MAIVKWVGLAHVLKDFIDGLMSIRDVWKARSIEHREEYFGSFRRRCCIYVTGG
jgi:hypothetical protein